MSEQDSNVGASDMFRLDGKVAIVTGASSGLGVAFARALAEAGADVALGARRVDRLEETRAMVEGLGRRAIAVATDVADPASCQALVDAAVEQLGRVDVLVNNAGVGTALPGDPRDPRAVPLGDRRQPQRLLLDGAGLRAGDAARARRSSTSPRSSASPPAGLPQAAYAASKAALIGLTRDLAQQWTGRKGIRVNALAPGFFASEMTDTYAEGYLDSQLPRVPIGRTGDPAELAATLVWLVSRGRRLRHRADPRRRRRHDDHLTPPYAWEPMKPCAALGGASPWSSWESSPLPSCTGRCPPRSRSAASSPWPPGSSGRRTCPGAARCAHEAPSRCRT